MHAGPFEGGGLQILQTRKEKSRQLLSVAEYACGPIWGGGGPQFVQRRGTHTYDSCDSVFQWPEWQIWGSTVPGLFTSPKASFNLMNLAVNNLSVELSVQPHTCKYRLRAFTSKWHICLWFWRKGGPLIMLMQYALSIVVIFPTTCGRVRLSLPW